MFTGADPDHAPIARSRKVTERQKNSDIWARLRRREPILRRNVRTTLQTKLTEKTHKNKKVRINHVMR